MITINLLSQEHKQALKQSRQQVPVKLVLLLSNLVALAVFMILLGMNISQGYVLEALSKDEQQLNPLYAQVVTVSRRLDGLTAAIALFEPLQQTRFVWSEKLNEISDALNIGVWLRFLALEKKMVTDPNTGIQSYLPYLKIDGSVYSPNGQELSVISAFVRNLRTDANFNDLIKNIDMEGLVRRSIATVEVMDFTLLCFLKEGVIAQ